MSYKTGKAKSLEDITLDDVLRNPIWEWAIDEEDNEEQDETWQRPIIDTDNVTSEMFNPTITLKIKGSEIYGSAEYDSELDSLNAISIWKDNQWTDLSEIQNKEPVVFISIPKIDGNENVEFLCTDFLNEIAIRIE